MRTHYNLIAGARKSVFSIAVGALAALAAAPAAAEVVWSDSAGGAWGVYAWKESGNTHCGMETAYYDRFDNETASLLLQLYAQTGLWVRYCDWSWTIPQDASGRGRIEMGRWSASYPVTAGGESCIDYEIGWDEGFLQAFRRTWEMTMIFPDGSSQSASLRGTNANADLLGECVGSFLGDGGTRRSTSPFGDGDGGRSDSSPF